MAKTPKFPGLQGKLERALRDEMGVDPKSGPAFLEWLGANLATYGISDPEFAHIQAQQSNYLTRAVNNGVLVRHGKKQGYSLAAGAAPTGPSASSPASAKTEGDAEEAAATPGTKNRQWESLLHFPLTVGLALRFDAHVLSLPAVVDSERWANPDLLMVRLTERARLHTRAPDLEADTFQLADSSPTLILSAVEVKFGLLGNRSLLFQAIAETAANSRWANEAWLAFFDPESGAEPGTIASDALSLARAAEVGVVELTLDGSDPDEPQLGVHVHAVAPTRSLLRFDELSPDRIEVLREAQKAIQDFNGFEATMLELEDDERLRDVVARALRNLGRQRGFLPDAAENVFPVLERIDAWKGIAGTDKQLVRDLLRGAVLHAAGDEMDRSTVPSTLADRFGKLAMTGPERSGAEKALAQLMSRAKLA